MDRRVGEQFIYERMLLKVVEEEGCRGCVFNKSLLSCGGDRDIIGNCGNLLRSDHKNVKFVEVDPNNP